MINEQALGISEEFNTEGVLNSMDANGDGTIDLEEWTTCMTPDLKRAIYRSLANPDKLKGFQPLVDVAKVNKALTKGNFKDTRFYSKKK